MEKKIKTVYVNTFSAKQVAQETYKKENLCCTDSHIYNYDQNGDLTLEEYSSEECWGDSYKIHYKDGKPVRTSGNINIQYTYDEQGRPTTELLDTGAGYAMVKRIKYNEDGSRVECGFYSAKPDDEEEIWRKEYDAQNNLVFSESAPNEDACEGYMKVHCTYDSNNHLILEEGIDTYSREYKEMYIYNELGKCIRELRVDRQRGEESPLTYQEKEHIYSVEETFNTNVYTCQAQSVDDFFIGNYTKDLRETYTTTTEIVVEENRKIKTFKYYHDDTFIGSKKVVTLLSDDSLLSCTDLEVDEFAGDGIITETTFEYWD